MTMFKDNSPLKRSFLGWLTILAVGIGWMFGLTQCGKEESEWPSAVDFRLKSLDGREITLSQFRGKVVLLDFWATWCPPCRESIPHLVRLQEKYEKRGLVILGMNVEGGNTDAVRRFLLTMRVSYPNVTTSPEVERDYGIRSLPTTVLIDKEGRIRKKIVGFNAQTAKLLDERVAGLISG